MAWKAREARACQKLAPRASTQRVAHIRLHPIVKKKRPKTKSLLSLPRGEGVCVPTAAHWELFLCPR